MERDLYLHTLKQLEEAINEGFFGNEGYRASDLLRIAQFALSAAAQLVRADEQAA